MGWAVGPQRIFVRISTSLCMRPAGVDATAKSVGFELVTEPLTAVKASMTADMEAMSPVAEAMSADMEAMSPDMEAVSPDMEAMSPVTEAMSPVTEAMSPDMEAMSPVVEAMSADNEAMSADTEAVSAGMGPGTGVRRAGTGGGAGIRAGTRSAIHCLLWTKISSRESMPSMKPVTVAMRISAGRTSPTDRPGFRSFACSPEENSVDSDKEKTNARARRVKGPGKEKCPRRKTDS